MALTVACNSDERRPCRRLCSLPRRVSESSTEHFFNHLLSDMFGFQGTHESDAATVFVQRIEIDAPSVEQNRQQRKFLCRNFCDKFFTFSGKSGSGGICAYRSFGRPPELLLVIACTLHIAL